MSAPKESGQSKPGTFRRSATAALQKAAARILVVPRHPDFQKWVEDYCGAFSEGDRYRFLSGAGVRRNRDRGGDNAHEPEASRHLDVLPEQQNPSGWAQLAAADL